MNFKLALAAAAVVGLAGTAQAADLAKKAPAAANYVKICDAYGAGYFYIPGTETCLKIGGYIRAELRAGGHNNTGPVLGKSLGSKRTENAVNTRARADITFDARTATEYGLLRSFAELKFTNDSTQNGASSGNMKSELIQAFIQFGGLTAGRAESFFDFIAGGYNIGIIEPDSTDQHVNLFGYTFAFGNGITASVAVEDQSTADNYALFGKGPYSAIKMPDLVANVAIAQAWGRAQVMGVLHQNYSAASVAGGLDSDKYGYAIGAGVEVNLPMLAAGDKAYIQGVYTKGAVGRVLINTPSSTYVTVSDFGTVGTSLEQSTAWAINGGFHHEFTKTIEANLGASYLKYEDFATANTNDFSQYVVGADIRWKPVSGFYIGAALDYYNVDYKPAGISNGDAWIATLRVNRSF
ncbi:MAG: porin [Hyphomicrobiales bacterium]|nr:porin [Hyphomicrobiales bacterium]